VRAGKHWRHGNVARFDLDLSSRLFRTGHNTVLLIALVLYLFALGPLLYRFPALSFILRVGFTLVLFGACYAIAADRRLFGTTVCLAVLLAALTWIGELAGQPLLLRIANIVAMVFLLLVAFLLLQPVLSDPPATLDKLFGAICIYLLLGLAWAEVFHFIHLTNPESFAVSGPLQAEFDRSQFGETSSIEASSIYVYYSFVTLTTTGYGDLSPVSPLARSMAALEAIVGPLYLAILIARLVSLMNPGSTPHDSK
jgi:hypothetical protein